MEKESQFFRNTSNENSPKDQEENLRNEKSYNEFAEQHGEKLETIRQDTRDKLKNFFSKSMKRICEGAKAGFAAVPDIQQLIAHLDLENDLEQNPVKKNLIEVLNFAGGVHSYSVETGVIPKDQENNRLKKIIGGVNNFLEKNEGLKFWLQDVVKRATAIK